jgi:hypothetical protein
MLEMVDAIVGIFAVPFAENINDESGVEVDVDSGDVGSSYSPEPSSVFIKLPSE